MLKIKDNVDLNILEEYAFEQKSMSSSGFQRYGNEANLYRGDSFLIIKQNRSIVLALEEDDEYNNNLIIKLLFDLIHNGLVEKVQDN